MIRRTIALSLVAVLAVLAPAGAQQGTTVGVGTANTNLDLADLSLTGLPVSGLSLGGLTSYASTVPDPGLNALGGGKPFALSSIRLPAGGEVTVRSDGNTGRPGERVDLGVGSVTLGDLLATVDEYEARSTVNALTGTVDAGLAGLQVGASGVTSVVSATNATATNGAVLSDLSVDLTDILPLDLLAQLPLDVLLRLTDEVGVPGLSRTLTRTLRDVRALVDQLEAIEAAHAAVDATQEQLAAAGEDLAAAAADLDAAVAGLTGAVTGTACADEGLLGAVDGVLEEGNKTLGDTAKTIDDVKAGLPGGSGGGSGGGTVGGIGDTVGGIGDTVGGIGGTIGLSHDACHAIAEAIAEVDDVEAVIATLNGTIDQLQKTLSSTVRRVNRLLDGFLKLVEDTDLSQLPALVKALVDGLAGTQLLGIDRLSVGVTSFADADGSAASVLCELRGLQVLGQTAADTCDALEAALGEVTAAIEGLLAGLPIVGTVTGSSLGLPAGVVSASAPKLHRTGDDHREGDYYVAAAGVQALQLSVASLQLTQVTDGLLADLLGQVDAVVGEVSGLTGVTVDLSAVDAALAEVLAVVDTLPAGEPLGGLQTPGLDLSALGVNSASRFSAAGTNLVPADGPFGGLPGTPGSPTGTGQTPTPAGDLPHTGGGVAAALLLLLAGGSVAWWLRRRPAAP